MPRLRQIPLAEATSDVVRNCYRLLFGERDPVAEPGTATGTPGDWWTVFANSPDALRHAAQGFAFYRDPKRKLDPVLRELGQAWAGYAVGSQFVFSQHCKAARAVGIPNEKVEAIPAWTTAAVFDEQDRAILAYTDDLVLQDGRVQDATFAALQAHLTDEAILELTYAITMYKLHATICRALRLEYDNVPERIVEIAAPAGQQSADVMTQISR